MTALTPIEDKRPDERLGSYLARAREARGWSVEEFASLTKITINHVTLIESGDWNAFPVEAYLRGYLNSMCGKLGVDSKRVLDWYASERGTKFASLLSEPSPKYGKVKPLGKDETKPRSRAVPIVIIVLGLAFVVASHLMENMKNAEANAEAVASVASIEDSVTSDPSEMPEGAEPIAGDSLKADSLTKDSVARIDSSVSQAVVDEALKKSDLPASATIFISSSSKKDSVPAPVASKHAKTRFELIGSGEMRTWVGLKRHEDDDGFLKESNISSAGTRMVYNASDTLYVVIGEPRAIAKMMLNGVETALPEMQFGRVTRFRVYDGRIVRGGH